MVQLKKPDYYKCRLRSRKDIIEFILEATHQRWYDYRHYPLCFDVKLHALNLDFAHLLQIWMQTEPGGNLSKAFVCAAYQFHQKHEGHLEEWAVDDARRSFVSEGGRRDGAPETDTFQMTWDGKKFDVRYSFEGRSGGWLSINRFQHVKLSTCDNEIEEILFGMDFKDLRMLYQLVVMLVHDLKNPEKEVEYQAAYAVFARFES